MTRLNLVEGTDEYFIAGLAMKVRSELGFSMLESTYERALMIELKNAGFPAERQVSIPVFYDGETLNHGYAADIIVDNRILLELKAVTRLYAMHRRQIQFYLCASGIQSGLLINFGNAKTIECERYEWIDSGYQVSVQNFWQHFLNVHLLSFQNFARNAKICQQKTIFLWQNAYG